MRHNGLVDGVDGGIGAALDLEFAEKRLEVGFDAVLVDEKSRSNFLVIAAFVQQS